MAPLTAEDRILIKCLREEKGWNAMRMMQEFPLRKWKKRTLNDLISKIDKTAFCRISLVIRAKGGHIEHRLD